MKRRPFSVYGWGAALGLTCLCASAWAALTHVVKKGETLSEIAQRFVKGPVYGRSGGLAKILESNPKLVDANRILAGSTLVLPGEVGLPEPAPASDPSERAVNPAPSPSTREEPRRRSFWELTPVFSFTRLDGVENVTGSQAVLLSSLNYGGHFAWHQVWNEVYRSFARVGAENIRFRNASNRILENASGISSSISLGGTARVAAGTQVGVELGLAEQIFHRASSTNTVAIDRVFVPGLDVRLSQTLIKASPFLVGIEAQAGVLFPASTESYKVRTGYGYRATLFLRQVSSEDPDLERLDLRVYLSGSEQNTSLVGNSRRDLGMSLGYKWEFDAQ